MRAFTGSSQLQLNACTFLENLMYFEDTGAAVGHGDSGTGGGDGEEQGERRRDPAPADAVLTYGGLPCMLVAMSKHLYDLALQACACR